MYHEILNGDTLSGNRFSGKAPASGIPLTDGRRIMGDIRPPPYCYATPTNDGTTAEIWPEQTMPVPPQPHKYAKEVVDYVPNVGNRVAERHVSWQDPEDILVVYQGQQNELRNLYWAVLRGGFIMTQGQNDYWLRSTQEAIEQRQQFELDIARFGWPVGQDGTTPKKVPVWLISQDGVSLWQKIKVNEAQWGEVMRATSQHFQGCQNAADAADDDLVAALIGDGELDQRETWTGTIADILAVDFSTYAWPTNPPSNGF